MNAVKTTILALSALGVAALAQPATAATVINFDDIPTNGNPGGGTAAMPAGYGGFSWDANMYVVNNDWYNMVYGNTVTFPSSPNAAYNGFGVTTVTNTHTPFYFDSADFAYWAEGNAAAGFSSSTVTVTGWYLGSMVGSTTLTLGSSFATLASTFATTKIDTLEISNDGSLGRWWLMDNLTISTAIPETSTWAMMAAGFAFLGFAAFRRRRRDVLAA
jgi:hypothetical protein